MRESAVSALGSPADLLAHFSSLRGLSNNQDFRSSADLYPEAPRAAERLHEAIQNKETIGIFGDYDCDGITSTTLLVRALRRHGAEPVVRLPHRVRDGYGFKPGIADEFAQAGVTLLITVDTGITANEAVARAKEHGIDVLILDHHQPRGERPEAFAILHPMLSPNYPAPYPAAAGITFDFLHAFEGPDWQGRDEDLAIATVGTVADLVPLLGHNRALVRAGLKAFSRLGPCPIKELATHTCADRAITSGDIAFRLAPRINAAGRMDDPTLALKALLEGGVALHALEELNTDRQSSTTVCLRQVLASIEEGKDLPAFLCMASPDYPPGVVGLLAGKLTETFGRPSLVAHVQGDTCTASLRSIHGYSVADALERHAGLLHTFGGHAQAGGCTFAMAQFDLLSESLRADCAERMPDAALVPSILIDAEIDQHLVSLPLVQALARLEPFGQGNPEPTFLLRNILVSSPRGVGGEGQHLRASVGQIAAIGFGLAHVLPRVQGAVDAVCRLSLNVWNGRVSPQLVIQDIRSAAATKDVTEKIANGDLRVANG